MAGYLGLDGDEAVVYAREVVKADFERPGEEDVFEKVWGDLRDKSVDLSEHRVRRQMADLMEEAERRSSRKVRRSLGHLPRRGNGNRPDRPGRLPGYSPNTRLKIVSMCLV